MPRPAMRDDPNRPVITLTTDFGARDFYVAALRAALIRCCPSALLLDVTHEIPRHDVLSGSIALERAVHAFAAGTVHLAVVDPGVGSRRRLLVVELRDQIIVCPDNGLITWPVRRHGRASVRELLWRPEQTPSRTFQGRDIMAPAAGMLAAGIRLDALAQPIDDPVLLDIAPALPAKRLGRIIYIDGFGNAMTNIIATTADAFTSMSVRVGSRVVGPIRETYADVGIGDPLALVGSSEVLEIAVREGSAASQMGIRVGDVVHLDDVR